MSFLLDEEKTWIQRDFGLDRRLIKALSKLGFTYPTLVQSRCIPIALQGKDVLVRARTGSGKTVAFSLPLLHKLLTSKAAEPNSPARVLCIILAPTKELCKQIEKHVTELIYYCRDNVSVCGLIDDNVTIQTHKLQSKPDIVISTPARLVLQLKNGSIDLSHVKTLVIDEADLVLSFGYTEDVHTITSKMPKIFQGLLMSATLSPELDKFKRVLLHNPAVLRLEEEKGIGQLLQFYLTATESDKFLVLYVFIKLGLLQGKGLIFVNDVNKCYKLKLFLQQFFISAAVLNSEVPLNSRTHMLEEFNRGVFDYLIATDASIDQGEEEESDDDDEGEFEVDSQDEGEEGDDDEEEGEDGDEDGEDFDFGDEDEDEEELEGEEDEEKEESEEEEEKPKGKRGREEKNSKGKMSKVEKVEGKNAKAQSKRKANGDADYGVSRGIDFQGVSFVINFDFPVTPASYTHRIGRTARGGASGTSLSFVTLAEPAVTSGVDSEDIAVRDSEVLRIVRDQQPRLGTIEGDNVLAAIGGPNESNNRELEEQSKMQPAPLNFNMNELESFRYRVEDTCRSVTLAAVKEFRTAELKREILNSTKLKAHFSENPNDLKVLRHDKAILHPIHQKDHLKHVPEYLIPHSMRSVARTNTGKKGKKRRTQGGGDGQVERRIQASKRNDPLMGGNASNGSNNNADNDNDDGSFGGESNGGNGGGAKEKIDRVFTSGDMAHGLGKTSSSSGRTQWKMRHQKGKFDAKKVNKESHRTPGAFVKSKQYK